MLDAISNLFSLPALGLMMLGTVLGVMVGAIPGLTGAMLIALTLPLTFSLSGEHALVLLVAMYVGSVSGGLITATLLRIPGTPASIMTTLDGYPLAQTGKAGRALGLGITASLVGGTISWCFLVLLSRPLAQLSLQFGPFEFFSLVLMAFVLIASISGKSLFNGLLAGSLGVLAAMPGASPANGQPRLTLGIPEMDDGFKLLPVLIGLFAVNQIIQDILSIRRPTARIAVSTRGIFLSWNDWKRQAGNLVRSSIIGTLVGILPGIECQCRLSVVAYSVAKNSSKRPEDFGQGSEEELSRRKRPTMRRWVER
ncbi:MAG: tripartite tricarboxylate transporter permease [Pirellulaceae bacterium]